MRFATLAAAVFVAPLLLTTELAAEVPIHIGSRLELFVDDFLIDELKGDAHQEVHQPKPREVVLVTGEPW